MNHLRAFFLVTFLVALLPLAAAGVVRKPIKPIRPAPFKTCTLGELRLMSDASGKVRFAQYGQQYPDNTLRVRQSYDRLGRLTGVSVAWSGFAGQMVDARASYDMRGQLIKETGFRARGFTTPLKSYVKPLPKGAKC
ncbi:hypothetical protein EHF33_02390 [Deinococcus psychrotolerans]|uniref:Uncharacterized protein n=1 Tax=Deinococcus psychrotolerans TaxID=2489213 RepID=A0A3G8YKX1_9DEIO|nr:hypothetical protein [Deinococcus psychrotolerans]AZI41736.1 hypothetical protein EHF33_02390 [Deinococcus psychrotolerans]